MKTVAVVVLLACTFVHGFEWQKEWDLWKETYGKKYDCDDMELSRRTIWAANKVFVDTHNANAKTHGYTVEMNEFADLVSTPDTFLSSLSAETFSFDIPNIFLFTVVLLV